MSTRPDRNKLYIPSRLEELLSHDRELYSGVLQVASVYGPWLNANRVVFFPEYTDHSIGHLEEVLDTATQLITDASWRVLTPSDAAVLILSVVLHDSGMHLQQHSFARLVDPDRPRLSGFADRRWSELWLEYGAELKRYSARQLNRIFSSSEPVSLPVLDGELGTKDYLVIGEFLRRHHHRLAHEIAIWGLPGEDGAIFSLRTLPEHIADLSGLTARSHGVALRSTIEYLGNRYRLPVSRDAHIVYVMGVLRIADYIQIQSSRAPHQQRVAFQIRVPISVREWNIHQAIADVSPVHEDPEALYVEAQPADVEAFLGFKQWAANVQHELDTTWAVYGEVYGRFSPHGLDKLGLTYRRIRSNIENAQEFAARVTFVPVQAAFEAASAELLQLLVGPLYGERPEIGIRELTQNAVDAVRERWAQESPEEILDVEHPEADVLVSLLETAGNYYVTVKDRGRGMSPDTITNYFLRAGASFRRSDAWRRDFEDEAGHSTVLRSGRFGVGALAAFLLGDTIEVVTRSCEAPENRAIHFTAQIESETIQLTWTSAPIGTTIRIPISQETFKDLGGYSLSEHRTRMWDWYCLEKPVIIRKINDRVLTQEWHLNDIGERESAIGWRRIKPKGYDEVHWAFQHRPYLVVNGIRVIDIRHGQPNTFRYLHNDPGYSFEMPCVSVFDPDGRLPLDLARNELRTGEYPFAEELLDDVVRDCLAWVVEHAPEKRPDAQSSLSEVFTWEYEGVDINEPMKFRWSPWLHSPEGIGMLTPWHLYAAQAKHFFVSASYFRSPYSHLPDACNNSFSLNCMLEHSDHGVLVAARQLIGAGTYDVNNILDHLPVRGRRIIMRETHLNEVSTHGKLAKRVRNKLVREWETEGWVSLTVGNCPASTITRKAAVEHLSGLPTVRSPGMIAEIFLDTLSEPEKSALGGGWEKWIGQPLLPYSLIERRVSLPHAFDAFREYIRIHAEVAQQRQEQEEEKKKRVSRVEYVR